MHADEAKFETSRVLKVLTAVSFSNIARQDIGPRDLRQEPSYARQRELHFSFPLIFFPLTFLFFSQSISSFLSLIFPFRLISQARDIEFCMALNRTYCGLWTRCENKYTTAVAK